jgi:uncharacterized protein YrrD
MSTQKNVRKWSELRGLKVTIPSQGKNAGIVEDFYFQPGTNSIYALGVRTPLAGLKALPANVIKDIVEDAVIIDSERMLTTRIPPFPLGSSLLNATVKGENEKEAGTISEVLIGTIPVNALRVAGYEVTDKGNHRSNRRKVLGADAILHYDENLLVIDNQTMSKM